MIFDEKNFTLEELHTLHDHAAWFAYWMVGQMMMLAVCVSALRAFKQVTFRRVAFLAFVFLSGCLGIGGIFVILLSNGPGPDWPHSYELSSDNYSVIQSIIVDVSSSLKSSLWYWIPLLCYGYSLPSEMGVRLTFAIKDDTVSNDTPSLLRPESIFSAVFQILACLLLGTYYYQDPTSSTDSGGFSPAIASGFTKTPYSYGFAPIWLLTTGLIGVAVWLTVLQHKLLGHRTDGTWGEEEEKFSKRAAVVGCLWFISHYACIWVAIPQFDGYGYVMLPMMVFQVLWIIVGYEEGSHEKPHGHQYQYGYAIYLIACMIFSSFHATGSVLLIIGLLMYELAVPALPGLVVHIDLLSDGETDMQAAPKVEAQAEEAVKEP